MSEDRRRVLFLCTHNSARSQMAEGLLRGLGGDRFEVSSAGTLATSIRPEATAVMAEIGFDISAQESKTLDRYVHQPIDTIVTVCDNARDSCPTFAGAGDRLHWPIPDPAAIKGEEEERLAAFRAARDELRGRIETELMAVAEGSEALEAPETPAVTEEHYRKLERMYLGAPANRYYAPKIQIGQGEAEISIEIRPEFFHAAGAVHGTVYFKILDDACFFAVASEAEDVFVLTTHFNLHLLRPVNSGVIRAVGRIIHRSRGSVLAEAEATDEEGRVIARGGGTFVRSRVALGPEVGYR